MARAAEAIDAAICSLRYKCRTALLRALADAVFTITALCDTSNGGGDGDGGLEEALKLAAPELKGVEAV